MLALGDLLKLVYLNYNEPVQHKHGFILASLILIGVIFSLTIFRSDDDSGEDSGHFA